MQQSFKKIKAKELEQIETTEVINNVKTIQTLIALWVCHY